MFAFRLQSVLDVRQVLEEKALVTFSEEQKRVAEEEAVLAELTAKRESIVTELKEAVHRPILASHLSMLSSYVELLQKRIAIQEEKIRQCVLAREEKRAALLEAVQKKKVMERLKEKQRTEFLWNREEDERKDMDEMSVLRFARRRK